MTAWYWVLQLCVCVLCLNSYFGFTKINQKVFVGKKWKAPTCPVPSVPISVLQPAMRTYKVRLSAVYSIAKKNNFAIIWLRIHPALLLNSPILQCFVCKYYTKGTDFMCMSIKSLKTPFCHQLNCQFNLMILLLGSIMPINCI